MANVNQQFFIASFLLVIFKGVQCNTEVLASLTDVSTVDDEDDLVSALAENSSAARLQQITGQLRETFTALPKTSPGRLGEQGVRYLLHRFFVKEHSWYVRGLEPNDASMPVYIGGDSVSPELQTLLAKYLSGHGMTLPQVASLAAFVETMVNKEASLRLENVYGLHGLPLDANIVPADILSAVTTYMMIYLKRGMHEVTDFTSGASVGSLDYALAKFKSTYGGWLEVEAWLRETVDRHVENSEHGDLDFAGTSKLAAELVQNFGSFNQRECSDLQSNLVAMQVADQTGRIRLSDFYAKHLSAASHWEFNEKADFLRDVGALDELSDPLEPRVLIPNYMSARSNCLDSSAFYSVCCRNPCEQLMGKLEADVAAPTTEISRVADFAQNVRFFAPDGTLSQTLLRRLDEIAAVSGGSIPIHSRLFAQWMHHAFPLQCPYPHVAGSINPQAPDEWIKQTGQIDTKESMRAMESHVIVARGRVVVEADIDAAELHWSDVEESYCGAAAAPTSKPAPVIQVGGAPSSLRVGLWCSGISVALAIGGYLVFASLAEKLSDVFDSQLSNIQLTESPRAVVKRMIVLVFGGVALLSFVAAADATGIFDRTAFVFALGLGGTAALGRKAVQSLAPVAPAKKVDDYWHSA